ncbi:neuropeptide-like 1 isoform X2 [Drosophila mojavensis]|uniref:neuropeptide-like 1 isoform X2 n=1 Tax=Drosophila mojavensis TaxID=7230 RepID=UPI001CD0D91B|nr:neuropeptide-like 1 isoform X2 [Drosophila mojavensis]
MQAVHTNAQRSQWLLLLFAMLLNAAVQPRDFAVNAAEDIGNVSPCEMETIINQLLNPSPEYQLHASALRNQLKNLLREREEQQQQGDYGDYLDEDKRSVAALAAQGLLNAPKRSLATLAKNGQLPTAEPGDDYADAESGEPSEQKRYIGSLARAGGLMSFGKRNVGTLARDFQLPNGKRNVATMARLQSAPSTHREQPKRNVAAVARYNSQQHQNQRNSGEKRNLGALKSSPVHGVQQKREDEEMLLPAVAAAAPDYADPMQSYWWYPSYAGYADLDWNDYRRAEKRFLDTSKDPELFGIEHGNEATDADANVAALAEELEEDQQQQQQQQAALQAMPQKRHIGAVYRSGFLPSYRYLRSPTGNTGGGFGGAGGRFSRSVEYYPQHERLRQPIAAVCKRCFLPNRPMMNWSGAGIRGSLSKFYVDPIVETARSSAANAARIRSISTNSLPSGPSKSRIYPFHSWGTPPRITALQRGVYRRNGESMDNYEY